MHEGLEEESDLCVSFAISVRARMAENCTVLDPTTQAFLDYIKERGYPELQTLPLAQAREQFARGQASVPVTLLAADVEHRTLPVGPSGSVEVSILRPR